MWTAAFTKKKKNNNNLRLRQRFRQRKGQNRIERGGDSMSSFSGQQPGSPFSEYGDLYNPASLPPTVLDQTWKWQQPPDMGAPRGLVVADKPSAQSRLTDEDKLCLFEHASRGAPDGEPKVPGSVGGVPGSDSMGNTSLGSTGESPDSPLSSSPFPSPASPGRLPSALGCEGGSRVSLSTGPGSRERDVALLSPASGLTSPSVGASLMEASPVEDVPAEQYKGSSFTEPSPKIAMPQVAPNYCALGITSDNDMKTNDDNVGGAMGSHQLSDTSKDNSDEEEIGEEDDLKPCFMGRAQQQRKAMRRAMSECTHLSVPTSPDLPDKYPGSDAAGLNLPTSPVSGSRRSTNSMKRSLTVAEDQPGTPPPTLSAAGATHIDLRHTPLEPRLGLSLFPSLKDANASAILSPLEKEPGGIVLPVPPSPRAVLSMNASSNISVDKEKADTKSNLSEDAESGIKGLVTEARTGEDADLVAGNSWMVAGGTDGDLIIGGGNNLGLTSSISPLITLDGRWR